MPPDHLKWAAYRLLVLKLRGPPRRSRMFEDGASRVRPRHVGPGKVSADTGRLTEVSLDKFSAPQRSVGEVRFGEVSARKVGLVDLSPGKIRLDKGCSSKVCFFERSLGKVSLGEVSRVKASLGEVSSSKVSFDKIGLGEVSPGKVSPTEIWPYLRMRRSPLVPDRYSLQEHLNMGLVCHGKSCLCSIVQESAHL